MNEEQEQHHRSVFAADSASHVSTASLPIASNGAKQRLQCILRRCIRKSGLKKPVDTDSTLKMK